MSIKVKLKIYKLKDPKLIKQRIDVPVVRVVCPVKFRFGKELTDSYSAIVDTGAPFSLIPQDIWERCSVKWIGKSSLRGIIPKKECRLSANIGEVSIFLRDIRGNVLETNIIGYFPKIDKVPLILGFEGPLYKSKILINCAKSKAFLELE